MIDELENYTKICKINELPKNGGSQYFVNEVEIAVFNINGEVYALNNICPHQHSAVMYDGFIENDFIVCPVHGWEFELKTGRRKCGSRGLDSYPVKIINDEVYIKVIKKDLLW